MKRWAVHSASALSLLLLLAVVALWVRSYPTKTEVQFWVRSSPVVHLKWGSGRILLDVSENALSNPGSSFEWSDSDNRFRSGRELDVPRELVGTSRPPPTLWQSGAKRAGPFEYGRDRDSWGLVAPHWSLAAVLAAAPALYALRFVRRLWRRRKGLCRACGYNLTANTSGVCPECGTPTGTAAVKPASGAGSSSLAVEAAARRLTKQLKIEGRAE